MSWTLSQAIRSAGLDLNRPWIIRLGLFLESIGL